LLAIWRLRHVFKKDGQVLLSYLPLYSLGRFFLTFVRQQNVTFGGLQQAQMIALFVFVASVAMWIYWGRKRALMVSVGDKSEPSALGQEEGR
jgi:phosphatidylglycerol:prolipoprotein diacylglycerol transferase